jgi:hypothetical protein
MSEKTQDEITPQASAREDDRDFRELLKSLIGQMVTIVNPESYEDAPVGHQIRSGFYRAKPVGLGRDYLILATEFVRVGTKASPDKQKEPVKQYIPISRIQRISIMANERLIHL